jgi:hypothetical protein
MMMTLPATRRISLITPCIKRTRVSDRCKSEARHLATHREGEDERASRADEEDDGDVEKEGGRGVEDEEGESDLVEDLVEGSGTLEDGDEERVEESADLSEGGRIKYSFV